MNGQNASLEQMVLAFNNIADQHAQINSFFFGNIDNLTTEQQTYPLLYVDIVSFTQDEWVDNVKFRIAVLDIEGADEFNELTIKSDCRRILRDINIWLRDYYDFEIVWNGTATPCAEELNDRLAGWYYDCEIVVPVNYTLCDIPLKQ